MIVLDIVMILKMQIFSFFSFFFVLRISFYAVKSFTNTGGFAKKQSINVMHVEGNCS